MAIIIRLFGWLGILGGAVAIAGAVVPTLPMIGAYGNFASGLIAVLNGALLVAIAELVSGMKTLNRQVEPLAKIGQVLSVRYGTAGATSPAPASPTPSTAYSAPEPDLDGVITKPPGNAQVYANGDFRVVLLADGRVIAQTSDGTRGFASLDDYKSFAGLT